MNKFEDFDLTLAPEEPDLTIKPIYPQTHIGYMQDGVLTIPSSGGTPRLQLAETEEEYQIYIRYQKFASKRLADLQKSNK